MLKWATVLILLVACGPQLGSASAPEQRATCDTLDSCREERSRALRDQINCEHSAVATSCEHTKVRVRAIRARIEELEAAEARDREREEREREQAEIERKKAEAAEKLEREAADRRRREDEQRDLDAFMKAQQAKRAASSEEAGRTDSAAGGAPSTGKTP
jgi:translation initiation factor IF-2